jgi:hypothetical protein
VSRTLDGRGRFSDARRASRARRRSSATKPCNVHRERGIEGSSIESRGNRRSARTSAPAGFSANKDRPKDCQKKTQPVEKRSEGSPPARGAETHPAVRKHRRAERQQRKREVWTVASVREALLQNTRLMLEKALLAIVCWTIPDILRSDLESLFGGSARVAHDLGSDMSTRVAAATWLIAYLVAMQEEYPNRHFYFFTFIDDRIRTKDCETCCDLDPFEKRVRAIMRDNGFQDWIGVYDFLGYKNWVKGAGRDVAPHLHLVYWTDEPIPRFAVQRKLRGSKRLVTFSGAPTVTIRKRKATAGNLAHIVAYMLMAPERAANLCPNRFKPGTNRQLGAYMRPDLGLRLMEILSQYRLSELVLSSGGGKDARGGVIDAIREHVGRRQAGRSIEPADAANLWERARRTAGKERFKPVEIIRRKTR